MLQIQNIITSYGAITALKGITLTIHPGQVVTLLGANGAGKSTCLNTISGILKPDKGELLFQGRDIRFMRPDEISNLGLIQVPEGREVFTTLSVEENLLTGAFSRNDRKAIKEDLEKIFSLFPQLQGRQKQLAGSLSGGEQQMLAIGRALMGRPKLLMLDEPSMGLAPKIVAEVFKTIQRIRDEGVTLLLVEQNAKKAFEVADYVYVLSQGSIVTEGPVSGLKDNQQIVEAYLGL